MAGTGAAFTNLLNSGTASHCDDINNLVTCADSYLFTNDKLGIVKCKRDFYTGGSQSEYCAEDYEVRCAKTWTDTTGKQGLLTFEVPTAHLEQFNGVTNWFYNYGQEPTAGELTWSLANNVEFVPMIAPFVNLAPNRSSRCYLHHLPSPGSDWYGLVDLCTYDQVRDVIQRTRSSYFDTTQYLMGYNELWDEDIDNDIPVSEVLDVHRKFIEPIATELGLDQVSFTVSVGQSRIDYMAEFLHKCYLQKDNATDPCDITKIKKWSVHNYNCKYDNWWNNYGKRPGQTGPSVFEQKLYDALNLLDNSIDWITAADLYGKGIFVTEHTCNEEVTWDEHSFLSRQQTCEHMSGQSDVAHGPGSLWFLHETPQIEKFTWRSMAGKLGGDGYDPVDWSKFITSDGSILPPGKAWLDPVGADCSYAEPTHSPTNSPTTDSPTATAPTTVFLSKQSYFSCEFVTVTLGFPVTTYMVQSVGGVYRQSTFLLHAYTGNTFPTAMGDQNIYESEAQNIFPWVNTEHDNFDLFSVQYDTGLNGAFLAFEFRTSTSPYLLFRRRPTIYGSEYIAVQNSHDTDSIAQILSTQLSLSLVSASDGSLMNAHAIRSCDPTYTDTASPTPPTKEPTTFPSNAPTVPTTTGGGIDVASGPPPPAATSAPTATPEINWGLTLGLALGLPAGIVLAFIGIKYASGDGIGTRHRFTSKTRYTTKRASREETARLVFGKI
jgi:hypothetical protein